MSGGNTPKGVWKDNFDAMALKTVLRNLLTKWGPMTVDMQTAYNADEEEHNEAPKDVTPEQNNEEGYQTQDILNSFDQAEKEKASKEEAKLAKKATKTTKKTATKGDEVNGTSESQEELFPDGTITPHAK